MEGADSPYAENFPEEPTLEDADNDETILEHMKEARTSAFKYFEYLNKDDWTVHTDKNGVKLQTRKYEESDLLMVKVEMEVNVSASNALKAFRDTGKLGFKHRKIHI